jgi:subtilisin family serine protease
MRVKSLISLIVAIAILTTIAAAQKSSKVHVPDEILVKFTGTVNLSSARKLHRQIGANLVEELGSLGWQRVKLPAGMSVDEALTKYAGLQSVESVQPNFYYHLLVTPNDPQFSDPGMYGLTKISAPAGWGFTTGSSAVVVADIDTGMRYTHEDLAANVWTNPGEIQGNGVDDDGNGFPDDYYGYDFRYNDPDPADEHGHGTHTAGTMGAVGNNLLGVVGVNWNVKIMPIKIYSATAQDTTSSMLINAYNYVLMMKNRGVNIRVTNNSYGGCPEACGYDQATKDAIDALGNAGILNVFAAGNSNANNDLNPSYPVSYDSPSILGVAASNSADDKPLFSNYGQKTVDVVAPGVLILSTTFSSNSSYGPMNGTSMAAPHVTGAAALLAAYNSSLSAASLKATLMNTVDQLSGWDTTPVKTNGRINVANALQNQTVCTFSLSNNSVHVPLKGGYFSVNVTTPNNCDFSTRKNVGWIHVSQPNAFSGNSTVTFRVSTSGVIGRSSAITIGGQTFTITQSR